MFNQIKINKADLAADVNAGMKKEELASKYTNGNRAALGRLLKQAGLRIKQTRTTAFVLVDEPAITTSEYKEGAFERAQELAEVNGSNN
jgi:hypothetical protein